MAKKDKAKKVKASLQPKNKGPVKGPVARRYSVEKNVNLERSPSAASSAVYRVPSDLKLIRALCRHLVHTNVYAKRAVSIRTSHFVGSGIRFYVSGNAKYNAALQSWANSLDCDYEGRKNLYGIQTSMVRTQEEAGEGIVVMRDVIDNETGDVLLKLQVVDPDMLAHDVREPFHPEAYVKSGVEHDEDGRVLGYHFRHKADDDGYAHGGGSISSLDTFFVHAKDVLHFFEPLYPGQLRGIPRATQVLSLVEIIKAYTNASMAKAHVEACSTVFIKRNPSDSGMGGYAIGDEGAETDRLGYPLDYIEPGLVWYLAEGEEIQAINPSSGGSFEPFIRIGLEAISAGFDVTYSQLSGDLSRVNFASEKAGRMEFNRGIESFRAIVFQPLMHRIEERFRENYILNNMSPEQYAFGGDTDDEFDADRDLSNIAVTLIPPARERIEPQKEALVEITELQSGALTWRQYILSRGKNPDIQMIELKAEREELAALGINLTFGSLQTSVNALTEVVAADDAQQAIEDNATMFDRKRRES